jgi:hypothetical protein
MSDSDSNPFDLDPSGQAKPDSVPADSTDALKAAFSKELDKINEDFRVLRGYYEAETRKLITRIRQLEEAQDGTDHRIGQVYEIVSLLISYETKSLRSPTSYKVLMTRVQI